MKKGFTLIELLAVIVILSIISVIAVPTILKVVDEAKKGAAEASALGYIDAVEKQIIENEITKSHELITDGTYELPFDEKYGVKVKGKVPDDGWITISKGKVSGYLLVMDNKYEVSYDGSTRTIASLVCDNYSSGEVVYQNGTPKYEVFTPSCRGTYKIELWGAQGGGEGTDLGGYTSGDIYLKANEKLYIYVGAKGDTSGTVKFNGGTPGGPSEQGVGVSGGGATDVRYFESTPSNDDLAWNSFNGLKARIMVAAGAGGGTNRGLGDNSAAGGLTGYPGSYASDRFGYSNQDGKGGTQTAGGLTGYNHDSNCLNCVYGTHGSFGQGGTQTGAAGMSTGSGGGGGGYYGGGAGGAGWYGSGGGGGSSFISGHTGCDAISATSTSSSIVHTGLPNHYSGKTFANTVIIDGKGYSWTTAPAETAAGMPTHDGTSTMTGNAGNGYAKITFIR